MAWHVRGSWYGTGKDESILNGDVIEPGSLLRPDAKTADHSITVLLPDGQRILYECFTVEDCARGFRVPSLYRQPEPFAVDMMARIQAVLIRDNNGLARKSSIHPEPRLPRDEALTVPGPGNRVDVGGLATHLANGSYTYDLRPLDRNNPRQYHRIIEKRAPSIALALPSSGLYDLTIADDRNTPRIDLFVAAVKPAQAAAFSQSFRRAQALLKEWNADYYGWPIHDFQRAYLESLMLSAEPLNTGMIASHAEMSGRDSSDARHTSGLSAEPTFSPKPGVLHGDTAVTLRCGTPGATMHYTIDGSQPLANSPLYGAPIMVKGTELTIKSFATAPGKKDSAVVTGIFRIRQ